MSSLCKHCNAEIKSGSKFCSKCGSRTDVFEYPTFELKSSGEIKYIPTDLSKAYTDMSNVRSNILDPYIKYNPSYRTLNIQSNSDTVQINTEIEAVRNSFNKTVNNLQPMYQGDTVKSNSNYSFSNKAESFNQDNYINTYIPDSNAPNPNEADNATYKFVVIITILSFVLLVIPVIPIVTSIIGINAANKLTSSYKHKALLICLNTVAIILSVLILILIKF